MDTTTMNAWALAKTLEDRGYVAEVEGHTVAFGSSLIDSRIVTAELRSGGRVAFVNIGGEFAGTQAYTHTDDLADTLVTAYDRGEL